MQKKASKCALIILFLALLYVPALASLIAGDRIKSANLENRPLAQWPTFSLENISKLPHKYELYYDDNLPFRDQLIFVRALINKTLYNRDIRQEVVYGKDGWLFYSARSDGDAIADYRGEDLFTREELRQISVDLRKTRDALKKQGSDFVLMIAPNKERIYSEYMPDRFGAPAEEYAAKQLVDFLRKHTDLKVIYPYEALMQAKADFPDVPIYYARDTHWNGVGAYVGTRELLSALGIQIPPLSEENILRGGPRGNGDLAILSHLNTIFPQDALYSVSDSARPAFSVLSKDSRLTTVAQASAGQPVLFFRHDSFGEHMLDYLLPWFSQSFSVFTQYQDDAQVDETHPDIYVMEVVERYVRSRLLKGPLYTEPAKR